ncbi:MAG: M20/M25/M40 family metallo-hydrolase, partial [Gemmatimonadaceae bacterium]
SLSCEDYGLVYRLTQSGSNPEIRMNLDAALLGERPVFNTVAMIRGVEKPDEYVVLSSHFDTWDGASGATDNGTGTLMMMEAMRILKSIYPNPRRTIISGHWTTEEQGTHGSRAFAEDHPEVLKGMQVLFNQDNGTGRITRISGAGLPDAAAHLTRWLSRLPEHLKGQVSYEGPGRPAGRGSDDASFSCHGVPAFTLGSLGWSYGNYTWHTNRDTYDKLVFEDLKSNAALAASLAYLASEEESFVSRERVAAADTTEREVVWPQCDPAGRRTVPRL